MSRLVCAFLACACAPLAGCVTGGSTPTAPATQIAAPAATADTAGAVPRITAAHSVGAQVFLRWRAGETEHYTRASRAPDTAAAVGPPHRRGLLALRTLVPVSAEQWAQAVAAGSALPAFGAGLWQSLLEQAQASITPREPDSGVAVDVLGEHELFHYYDAYGVLRTVPIEYKPPQVTVRGVYRLDELLRGAIPRFREAVAAGPSEVKLAILETADPSPGGYPFVLVDVDRSEVLFLRDPPGPAPEAAHLLGSATETTAQLATSHVRSLLEQPVSALARLFTLASTTTLDLLDPRALLPPLAGAVPPVVDRPGMDLAQWERELDQLTGLPATRGTLRYLVDGEEFFLRLIDVLSAAQRSVHMRLYIFDNDDVALRIADLLKRRSREIEVAVLIDGLGTIGAAAAQPEHRPGGAAVAPSIARYLTEDSDVRLRVLANPWLTGDHTKSIVIDERMAFLGGMNIGREYRYEWHDLMVEVSGPVVDSLRADFARAWAGETFLGELRRLWLRFEPLNQAQDPAHLPVRVLATDPPKRQILDAQLRAIRRAQQRILIENAYFTSDAILYELAVARRRGVDVRVILPLRSDLGLMSRANAIAANTMLANGIRVYIYPGMSHVKAAVYDGWACLGSANFDTLSLSVNKELNLATSDAGAVERLLERVFLPDLAASVELTRPFPPKWSDFLAELLSDRL